MIIYCFSINISTFAASEEEARPLAEKLRELNETRKKLTLEGLNLAKEEIASQGEELKDVLVVYLPDCHESVAGIIAGRLRENYNRPVLVVTGKGDIVKGSGRSIPAYNLYEGLEACRDLLEKFGGHAMAVSAQSLTRAASVKAPRSPFAAASRS